MLFIYKAIMDRIDIQNKLKINDFRGIQGKLSML